MCFIEQWGILRYTYYCYATPLKWGKTFKSALACEREKETGSPRRRCGVEKAGLVGFCAVWLGNDLPMFRRKIALPSSELKFREMTHKPEDGGTFLRKFEKKFSNHTAQQTRRLGSSTFTHSNTQTAVLVLLRMY
jgi:hypothetical protein